MKISIIRGFDSDLWRNLRPLAPQHDVSWLAAMFSRLPGEPVTLSLGSEVAFCGMVLSEPEAYEAYNPYAILWRDPPVFDLSYEADRAAALASYAVNPEVTLPALVLVAPGYCGDPAGEGASDSAAVKACLSEALTWCAQQELAGLHILYATADAVGTAAAALGAHDYPLTTRWTLPVWWDDWSGYLEGLPHQRGREVKRQARRAAEAGISTGIVDVEAHLDAIIENRCSLLRRYGQHADATSERARLLMLRKAFGERLVVHGAWHEGELVALSVCLRQSRTLNVLYSGTTDKGHELPFAHFIATFHAPIENSSRVELDNIDFGISHGVSKKLRGCQPQALTGYAIGIDPARHRLLGKAASLLTAAAPQ